MGVASTNLDDIMAVKDKDAGTLIGAKEDLDKLLTAFQKQSTNILEVALEDLKVKDLLAKLGKLADETEKLPNFAEKSMGYLKDILATLKSETEKAKEYVFGGEDGRNFYDNITPWMTANEKGLKAAEEIYGRTMDGRAMTDPGNPDSLVDADGNVMGLNNGTYGFRDFGRGTPAILHGREMVIPEANASKIVSDLIGSVKTMEGTGNITSAPSNSGELRELIALYTRTLESNEKMSNSLNRLVTIGAMTEKNTKSTNNNLANMGGSLV